MNEGLWSGIKGAVSAGVRGGADLARRALPELTNPFDNLEKNVREIGDEFRAGWHRGSSGFAGLVNDNLTDEGYTLANGKQAIIKSGRYYVATAHKKQPKAGELGTEKDDLGNDVPVGAYEYRFLIDREGRIIRNIDRNRIDTRRSSKMQNSRRNTAKKGRA